MSRTVTRRALGLELAGLYAMAAGAPAFAQAQAPLPPGRSLTPAEEQANVAIVNEFCAAFGRHDLAAAVALLADNCTYRPTQTRPAVVGKAALSDTIKGFMANVVEFKVLKTVVLGPIVLNERDDIFKTATGTRTFRVGAGLFFVDQKKIVEWTDYLMP